MAAAAGAARVPRRAPASSPRRGRRSRGAAPSNDPTLAAIGERHGKSATQVAIRWHLQQGNVVIPKSASPERIRANADVFDFELTDADLEAIARLDAGERTGRDPDDD